MIIPFNWDGNYHIMPQVKSQLVHITNPLLSKPDLQKFNLCCIYLQVLTLSDIATSSGKRLTDTSGMDFSHSESHPSIVLIKSNHLPPARQSGASPFTCYSQSQSGSPESYVHIAPAVGSKGHGPTHFGLPTLIPLPPRLSPYLNRN